MAGQPRSGYWRTAILLVTAVIGACTLSPAVESPEPATAIDEDLRAYAASVVVDSGGTMYESAALLRHADVQTTNRYYARAQDEKSHDHERARLRVDMDLPLPQRIDALWDAWCTAHPQLTAGLRETPN